MWGCAWFIQRPPVYLQRYMQGIYPLFLLSAAAVFPQLLTQELPRAQGSRNLMLNKRSKATSPRPSVHRKNMETFVAIGRLWLICGEYKLNGPFCKTGARALDLRHINHLFVWALPWAFPDLWSPRCKRSPGDLCLHPLLLLFPSPPHPLLQTGFGQPTSQPLSATSPPYFSLVVTDALFGTKRWGEVNGHSCATEVVIFISPDDLQGILL